MAFVPAHEEEQLRLRTAAEAELPAFCAQWEMEDMPACPAGMLLLREFADASPAAFELARKQNFTDPALLRNNKRWCAFEGHRSTCPDCNESGTGFRPFDGAVPR